MAERPDGRCRRFPVYQGIRETENAAVVGKLYKGDVAEIAETGDTWTHVESGNVDGYVKNSYCVTGSEAYTYANDTI